MSSRKGLIFILLLLLGFSTLVPAFAVTTLSGGNVISSFVLDTGTVINGAKPDVDKIELSITVGTNELNLASLAPGSTTIAYGNDGALTFGGVTTIDASAYFLPPTGCKFVKLSSYVGTSGDFAADREINVTLTGKSNLANFAGNTVFFAQVLSATAADVVSVPAGSLAIHGFSDNTISNPGGNLTVTVNNIGLACNAAASPATSGDLQATYVAPTSVGTNLFSLAPGQQVTIGTLASAKKLEALLSGTTTGNVPGVLEPDMQPGALNSAQVTSSAPSVSFGPSLITVGGSLPRLDTDTIIIRAAEKPESTAVAKRFFQTPFATAAYTANSGTTVSAASANAAQHSQASLTSEGVFTNVANSVITVTFSLENTAGSPSTATLQLNNAYVGFHGNQVSSMLTGGDAGYTVIGDSALDATLSGFLGAFINNVDNGLTGNDISAATDAGIIVVADSNNDGVADNLTVQDGSLLSFAPLPAARLGGSATEGLSVLGINGAPSTTVIVDGTSTANFDDAFLFPGSVIHNVTANRSSVINSILIPNLIVNSAFTAGADNNPLRNAKEFYINLKGGASPAGDISYIIIHGDEAAADRSLAADTLLGPTNFANESYEVGPSVYVTLPSEVKNNVLLASQLVKSGSDYVLRIVPLVNKYDNLRDVLTVRAKGVINNVTPAVLAAGLKLVATVSGNNLTTTKLTLAEILAPASFNSNLTTRVLPAGGTAARLMVKSATNSALNRLEINPATIDGSILALNALEDLIPAGSVLDTTLPPLFTGGKVGNTLSGAAARGPIAHIQAKGRVIAIEETNTDDFSRIANLAGTKVIRVTFPTGIDINKYTSTATNLFDIFSTNTFTVAPTIATVQNIGLVGATTVSRAFVDISLGTANQATAQAVKKKIFLGIKPHALVVTDAVVDASVALDIIDTLGTADPADDILISSIGTASLGTVSKFLKVAFSDKATSAYQKTGTTTSKVRSVLEATNGAQRTNLGAITKAVRFVNATPVATLLPDLDITEQVADAIPLGSAADGRPASFSEAIPESIELHCATTLSIAASGFDGVTGVTALVSDLSIDPGTLAIGNGANEIVLPLALPSTVTVRAADVATTITLRGLKIKAGTASTAPAEDDIVCWIEANDSTGGADEDVVVGSNVANAVSKVTASSPVENIFIPIGDSGTSTLGDAIADLYAGTALADPITLLNWNNPASVTTNDLAKYTVIDADDKLDNAISSVTDNAALKLLTATTLITTESTDLPTINGVADATGDLRTTVSGAAGLLQPGTLIQVVAQVNPQGGGTESVTVPVLDNGSFTASLRATPRTKLTLTQLPTSTRTPLVAQVQEITAPTKEDGFFDTLVPTLLTSTITNKGTVIALFNTPATDGFNFTDVEATAKVNNVPVRKIATGKYAAIIPTTASTFTLTVTSEGRSFSTTLDVVTIAATGKGVSTLGNVSVNADNIVTVKLKKAGTKFPPDTSFEIVYTDGTTAVIANSLELFKKAGTIAKFTNPQTAKTIAGIQAVSAGGVRAKFL